MTAFTCLHQTPVPALNLVVEVYRHTKTGARHLHLASSDEHNAFIVGFLTLPEDGTGVAHILEHLSLCGSQNYPVRDPFFSMDKRSLHTFMNAFTACDWTGYAFASQNKKDFENLNAVFNDAVFFPNLDPLDFLQEGWRLEFETPDDTDTPLLYKGVVYNEMKGANNSPIQRLLHLIQQELFNTAPYHYNSGGDVHQIPDLSYQKLKEFYHTHYHPSNAAFITYGDIPAATHQARWQENVLSHFETANPLATPELKATPFDEPKQAHHYYPNQTTEDTTHIVMAWVLDPLVNTEAMLNISLMAGVLLDHSASPLRHALETCHFGLPSPVCGSHEHTYQIMFMCGVESANPEYSIAVEELVFAVLEQVCANGLDPELVNASLHQIELMQRDISAGDMTYGLRLASTTIIPLLYGGNPLDILDIEEKLVQLRERCQDPSFIPELIKRYLLNNPHRVRLTMEADEAFLATQSAEETTQLALAKARLNDAEKAALVVQAQELHEHQHTFDDPNILPKLGLEDISPEQSIPVGRVEQIGALPTTWYECPTNGLIYQTVVITVPELSEDLLDLLPIFCDCVTEVGRGDKDYLSVATEQLQITSGLSAQIGLRGSVENTQKVHCIITLSGKALVRDQAKLTQLLHDTLAYARFDELPRLKDLVEQICADVTGTVVERIAQLMIGLSSTGFSPAAQLNHQWYGLGSLQFLRTLQEQAKNTDALQHFADKLKRLHEVLWQAPKQLLTICEAAHTQDVTDSVNTTWISHTLENAFAPFSPPALNTIHKQIWTMDTPVNYCVKSYPTVAVWHADAAPLMVLGMYIHDNFLHRAIREQGGAYGGGAHYDGNSGTFRFYSYHDPRLLETLSDFDRALQWIEEAKHEKSHLDEAILSIIRQLDRPTTPAGDAKTSFIAQLYGRTPSQRQQFRQRLLAVSLEDLKRVTSIYLQPAWADIAVCTDKNTAETVAQSLNAEVFTV